MKTLEKNEMQNGQNGGAMVRSDSFGGQQLATVQETASTAMAAQAKAVVEARSIMAMHNPRNFDQVRTELLRECQRPSFAEVARYRKPVGAGIEGLSIRFVEQALQILGNCETSAVTVYDDDVKRIVAVIVMDYERNVCHSTQITVQKTVERSKLRNGQTALGRRTGAGGQTVYIVAATDDDLLNKQGSLVSKAIRTNGLRLIPGWLQDEAEQAIKATAQNQAAKDPDAERRKLADAFAAFNVQPVDLEEYLAHDLDKISPAELVELRQVYMAIKDGQTNWQDTIEHRRDQQGTAAPRAAPATQAAKGAQAVKDKLAAKKPAPVAKPVAEPKLDAGQAAPNESIPVASAEAKGVAPGAKKPSRSKAAQEQRKAEVAPMNLTPSKCLTYYVQNGDPRNLVKAQELTAKSPPDHEAAMEEAAMERDHESVQAETSQRQAKLENSTTTAEPEWMRGGPPPGEEFE